MQKIEDIKIVCLGGLEEEGKNCIAIRIEDDIFIVEAGMKYPPQDMPGIEYITPDPSFIEKNKSRIRAFIITHGHDDQFGAIYKFKEFSNAPIYCTKTTKILIEYSYKQYTDRDDVKCPYDFKVIDANDDVTIAGHNFHFFSTCHSVSQSFGFFLETNRGCITYTGDFMTDYNNIENFTFNFSRIVELSATYRTLILLAESTSSLLEGVSSPTHSIVPHISKFLDKLQDGRLYLALYQQNHFNIKELIDLCRKLKKKICVVDTKFEALLKQLIKEKIFVNVPEEVFVTPKQADKLPRTDTVCLITGSGAKAYELIDTVVDDIQYDDDISLLKVAPNDNFVVACPIVPGIERKATEIIDKIYRRDCNVTVIDRKVLSAMHAQQEDLKLMISIVKPHFYFPIKGDYQKLITNATIATRMHNELNSSNTFVLENGEVIIFSGELGSQPRRIDIACPEFKVDGLKDDLECTKDSLLERQTMSSEGILVVSCILSKTDKHLITNIDIQTSGLSNFQDDKQLVQLIYDKLEKIINDNLSTNLKAEEIEYKISETIRHILKSKIGSSPLIKTLIIDKDRVQQFKGNTFGDNLKK